MILVEFSAPGLAVVIILIVIVGSRCSFIPILVQFSGLRGAVADSESAKWIFNWHVIFLL